MAKPSALISTWKMPRPKAFFTGYTCIYSSGKCATSHKQIINWSMLLNLYLNTHTGFDLPACINLNSTYTTQSLCIENDRISSSLLHQILERVKSLGWIVKIGQRISKHMDWNQSQNLKMPVIFFNVQLWFSFASECNLVCVDLGLFWVGSSSKPSGSLWFSSLHLLILSSCSRALVSTGSGTSSNLILSSITSSSSPVCACFSAKILRFNGHC